MEGRDFSIWPTTHLRPSPSTPVSRASLHSPLLFPNTMMSLPGVEVNTSATPPGRMYRCLGVRPARLTIEHSPCQVRVRNNRKNYSFAPRVAKTSRHLCQTILQSLVGGGSTAEPSHDVAEEGNKHHHISGRSKAVHFLIARGLRAT